jgi:hypothetical protein
MSQDIIGPRLVEYQTTETLSFLIMLPQRRITRVHSGFFHVSASSHGIGLAELYLCQHQLTRA